ncbi:hypothetical protein ACP70R_038237 [Stipagrostis hirtigluma subsp. patula]
MTPSASSTPAAAPVTIGEAYPENRKRGRTLLIGTVLLVAYLFFSGYAVLTLRMTGDPLLLSRARWLAPMLVAVGVYLSLAQAIRSYAHGLLPRTPVPVDDAIAETVILRIGACFLIPLTFVALWVEDDRIHMALTGFVAVLIAGQVAFWAWLVHNFAGPAPGACRCKTRVD